ncbi:hypothetical protein [Streptomyces mirabilis]|uniref:hypothetical protein n=1 Tax=Streptomyces mirabilis TaxID=68239 RepID=UPI00371AA6AF
MLVPTGSAEGDTQLPRKGGELSVLVVGIGDRLAATAIDRPVRHSEVIPSKGDGRRIRGRAPDRSRGRHQDMTNIDWRSRGLNPAPPNPRLGRR